jgi:hypothetical protein
MRSLAERVEVAGVVVEEEVAVAVEEVAVAGVVEEEVAGAVEEVAVAGVVEVEVAVEARLQ